MKTMLTLALTLVAVPATAQTQADLNRSGVATYRAADAALNAQYKVTMAAMASYDASRAADLGKGYEKPDGDPTYRAALLASQRAWLGYRDAQCTLASFEFRGGSAQGMAKGQCLTDLTRRRTAELKQMLQNFRAK